MSSFDNGLGDIYSFDTSVSPDSGGSIVATSTPDLSSLQTINYGGGQSLYYDPTSNTYLDSGGNVLQPSDVAQYGAPVSTSQGIATGGGGTPPGAGTTAATNSQNQSGIFTGVLSAFSAIGGVGSALNPPRTVNGVPMVYNAATGGYVPATAAGNAISNVSLSPIFIFVGIALLGVIVWFAVRK